MPLQLKVDGKTYKGEAIPIMKPVVTVFAGNRITLNDQHLGIINNMKSGWKMDEVKDQKLVNAIGEEILLWYE